LRFVTPRHVNKVLMDIHLCFVGQMCLRNVQIIELFMFWPTLERLYYD